MEVDLDAHEKACSGTVVDAHRTVIMENGKAAAIGEQPGGSVRCCMLLHHVSTWSKGIGSAAPRALCRVGGQRSVDSSCYMMLFHGLFSKKNVPRAASEIPRLWDPYGNLMGPLWDASSLFFPEARSCGTMRTRCAHCAASAAGAATLLSPHAGQAGLPEPMAPGFLIGAVCGDCGCSHWWSRQCLGTFHNAFFTEGLPSKWWK